MVLLPYRTVVGVVFGSVGAQPSHEAQVACRLAAGHGPRHCARVIALVRSMPTWGCIQPSYARGSLTPYILPRARRFNRAVDHCHMLRGQYCVDGTVAVLDESSCGLMCPAATDKGPLRTPGTFRFGGLSRGIYFRTVAESEVLWNAPLHSWTGVAAEAVEYLMPLSAVLPNLGLVGGYVDAYVAGSSARDVFRRDRS